MIRAIRRGIERNEFELHYQPQIDIQRGCPSGVEAMLRWRRRGVLLPPARFLADAESSSVIGRLTDHVLDLALAQAGEWHRAGRGIRLAVNLSAANLRDFSVVERLQELLPKHGAPAGMITLEVTETAVLDEPEKTRAVLDRLAELGFSISVDDFGTGYSSLLWLRLFPVDEVKIDRTFVSNMHADGEAFVSGVIRLGHDLGLSVVGEGVEDESTLEALQALGCDLAQGMHFSAPLPAEAVEAWLAQGPAAAWKPNRREVALSPDERGLDEARAVIEQTASELGFDDAAIWDMKLAATEALTNAIDHGTVSPDGMIHMRLAQARGEMLLEVWGGGKDDDAPQPDDPRRGRGIAIMTALMDGVELKRDSDDTVIRLAKRQPSAERLRR